MDRRASAVVQQYLAVHQVCLDVDHNHGRTGCIPERTADLGRARVLVKDLGSVAGFELMQEATQVLASVWAGPARWLVAARPVGVPAQLQPGEEQEGEKFAVGLEASVVERVVSPALLAHRQRPVQLRR